MSIAHWGVVMPCTCDGYPAPAPDLHSGPVAEALCKVMQEHEARGEMGCFDAATLKWWEDHKERDRRRIKQDLAEAGRRGAVAAALAKLSPFERELLGLRD